MQVSVQTRDDPFDIILLERREFGLDLTVFLPLASLYAAIFQYISIYENGLLM
jgi:hypothetical protein